MKIHRLICIALFGTIYWALGSTSATADDATKRRFESEYSKSAKAIDDRISKSRGSIHLHWIENKFPHDLTIQFFRSHGFEKVETNSEFLTPSGPIKSNHVECIGNGDYFELSKQDSVKDYKLRSIKPSARVLALYDSGYGRCLLAPLGGYQKPLFRMLEDRTAKLLDASQVPSNPSIVEAKFQVSNNTALKQLVVRFDTDNSWAVVNQKFYVNEPLVMLDEYQVEYGPKVNGIAFPKRFTTSSETAPYDFGTWVFEETPREAFLLPHYGLPDVIALNKSRSFFSIKWISLAIAVILFSVGIWLFRKSNQTSGPRKAMT